MACILGKTYKACNKCPSNVGHSWISHTGDVHLQAQWDLSHSGSCRNAHRTLLPVCPKM